MRTASSGSVPRRPWPVERPDWCVRADGCAARTSSSGHQLWLSITGGASRGSRSTKRSRRHASARLGQAVRAISNIDVLFVVDATESMGPYLRSVVRALQKHVERAMANLEWSFRYSVVLYGDYNSKRQGGLDYYAIPFRSDLGGL